MKRRMEMVYQLCVLVYQLKEWGIYICFLVIWWTIPKKTNRKFLLIKHSLQLCIDTTKSELYGSVPNGFGRFFFLFGKKTNPSKKTLGYSYSHILVLPVLSICLRYPMILYDVKVSWIQVFFCLIVY